MALDPDIQEYFDFKYVEGELQIHSTRTRQGTRLDGQRPRHVIRWYQTYE